MYYLLEEATGKLSFIMAKSQIITKQLQKKSIAVLEFQAVCFGAENLIDLFRELTCPSNLCPVNVTELLLFTDSMVALNWIGTRRM